MRSKILVIVGPTASGKSELAVRIAKKYCGEIISADSRQVYRGLDIGTGKVPGQWIKGEKLTRSRKFFTFKKVQHHCIDFVPPQRTFTAAEFKKCAEEAIKNITGRGKIPILVGGTAFWIDAVVYGLNFPEVPPDPKLRRRLEKKNAAGLLKILQRIDPARAKTIEPKNPRRLIRAIEIVRTLGKIPKLPKKKSPYKVFWLGLKPSYEASPRKIRRRVKGMIKRGLANETKKLLREGFSEKRIREFGFEYRAALEYLEGDMSRPELGERLIRDTSRYARRQMAWWKRNPKIHWIASPSQLYGTNISRTLASFLASRSQTSSSSPFSRRSSRAASRRA